MTIVRAVGGVVVAMTVVMLTGRPSAGQAPAAAGMRLKGAWRLDHQQTPDGQDVWRRRVDGLPASNTVPAAQASTPPPAISGLDQALLRAAMRDLLEIAERLTFEIGPDSVTVTDDLDRSRTYATTGAKEKRQLAATEFTAKTHWSGQALTQEVAAWTFSMTQVFLPREDRDEMVLSIKIDKPEFQPPLKEITRIYVRAKSLSSRRPPRP